MDKNFGKADGAPVENWAEILSELDRRIGTDKPPALEYLFCLHALYPDSRCS
jgi:hypothetical protein